MTEIKFTPRAIEMIEFADKISKKSNFNGIHPIHLFLGFLKMESDTNTEINTLININDEKVEKLIEFNYDKNTCEELSQIVLGEKTVDIFLITKKIMYESKRIAEMFEEHGQIMVNDGQILKAIFSSEDEIIQKCLKNFDKELILSIASNPRDMIVGLHQKFECKKLENIVVKKVSENDKNQLRDFVLKNFYDRWAKTVEYGLSLTEVPIYIAEEQGKIVGFAGYNISKQRKGYFGPLGVLKSHRQKGIGEILVKSCMNDMKKLGYETCIIGNGSSIEFYEKACGAKNIPIKL